MRGGDEGGINIGVSGIRGGRGRFERGKERDGGLETVIEVPEEEEKKAEEKEEEEKKRREEERRKGPVGVVDCGYEGDSIRASWVDGGRWR